MKSLLRSIFKPSPSTAGAGLVELTKSIDAISHRGRVPAQLETNKWAQSEMLLQLVNIVGAHPYPLDELMLMASAFEYHRPNLVVEIGTHIGKSCRVWCELNQLLGTNTEIHTIDLCDPEHPENPGESVGMMVRDFPIHQHLGDGVVVAEQLLKDYPGRNTLLFLDGDHSYETVCKELELVPFLTQGCALLHDTFYQPNASYNHGPYEALMGFLERFTPAQVVHQHLGLPGMSYLRIGEAG